MEGGEFYLIVSRFLERGECLQMLDRERFQVWQVNHSLGGVLAALVCAVDEFRERSHMLVIELLQLHCVLNSEMLYK